MRARYCRTISCEVTRPAAIACCISGIVASTTLNAAVCAPPEEAAAGRRAWAAARSAVPVTAAATAAMKRATPRGTKRSSSGGRLCAFAERFGGRAVAIGGGRQAESVPINAEFAEAAEHTWLSQLGGLCGLGVHRGQAPSVVIQPG